MPRLLPALFVLLAALPASAEEQLIYAPLVTDGTEYRRISYPAEAGQILVLADTEIILEARRAEVTYWPITREYIADLAGASEPVTGAVEIVDGSGNVTVVSPEPYLQWHPDGVGAGPVEIVRGDQVTAIYTDYVAEARASLEEMNAHQRVVAEHQALVEEWIKLAGERRGKDMPPPPPVLNANAPEPYRAYASEPAEAAVVSLPAGRYTIRIRDEDGNVVPGSERELVSFAPEAEGVGYVIRPEDRWTQPLVSFAPNEVIYSTGRTDLFFQPVPVKEYRADYFARLFQPQSVESPDPETSLWTPRPLDEAPGSGLGAWSGGRLLKSIDATGYRVAQRPGVSRGYDIEEFQSPSGALQPDFVAMRLDSAEPVTKVALLEDSSAVPGSTRVIRTAEPPQAPLVFLPALLPLLVGVAWKTRTSLRTRRKQ